MLSQFIANYWQIILFVLVVLFVSIVLIRRGQIDKLKEMVLYLVTEAEDHFGGGTGPIKKAQVMTFIYEALPTLGKILLSTDTISGIIEDGKVEMDALNESKALALEAGEANPP